MKTISKIITLAGSIGLAVGLMTVSSLPTYAVEGRSSDVCTHIATMSDSTSGTIAGYVIKMNDNFKVRLANIANRTTTLDPKVDAARTKAAQTFDTQATALESKTGVTATQKTAIETFVTNMKAAEKTRETAVDAARTTYRTDLTAAVKTHQASLTAAVTAYQTSVATAFATAGANCGDATASTTLKAAIKTAKDTLKTAQSDAKITANIKALMTTRNAAIKSANETFIAAAASYKTTLLEALKPTTSSTNS